MPHKDPLQIPETADVIASFLQPQDLARCVCVSKSWREVFLPLQWQAIELGCKADHKDTLPNPGLFGPPPDVVSRYRHLIHHLTLVKEVTPFIQRQYPNVHKLTINYRGVRYFWKASISLDLKETFPSLVRLTLTVVRTTSVFWKALEAHSRIKILHLEDINIDADSSQAFWKVVEGMEVLDMEHSSLPCRESQRDTKCHRVRKLVLDVSWKNHALFELVTRCPMSGGLGLLLHSLRHPCSLHRERRPNEFLFWDTELASLLQCVLNGREHIARLSLATCYLGTKASTVLGLYYNSLVEVDLTDCAMVPSTTTRDLLCHCPRLEVLGTRRVMAGDIVAGEPWVCQQLRKLTACFWFQESERNLQQDIFWRLSTLTRLEELTMRILKMDVGNGYALAFRRDCGMEHLESLRELTTFRFLSDVDSIHAELGMYELKWIEEHWKKLKILEGRLNSDHEVDAQLKRALEAHGISVT
ncbi:MAG: hypothetical protein J3Q66DRAFT_334944 [Benniella sp.]|nr:MAG: hypothetical protein J3Q66DRAFT_334944 [Benniella sp.]